MSGSESKIGIMSEPTLADVLTVLKEQRSEIKVLQLEVRAGFAESRARDAELSNQVSDTRSYLGETYNAVADLRNDFEAHGPHS